MTHLAQYQTPIDLLEYGEYSYDNNLIRKQGKKGTSYEVDSDFGNIVTALLNTCGGVIRIKPPIDESKFDHKAFDEWRSTKLTEYLNFVPYPNDISMKFVGPSVYVLIYKSQKCVTFDSHLYHRVSYARTEKARIFDDIRAIIATNTISNTGSDFSLSRSYKQGEVSPHQETANLEYKLFNCNTPDKLIIKLRSTRVIRTLLAMGNLPSGGDVILGVDDQTKRMEGQELDPREQPGILRKLEILLREDENGCPRVWGDPNMVPLMDKHWLCKFIELQLGPDNTGVDPRFLICIRIFHCPGGVFERIPEAFTVNDDGSIRPIELIQWKEIHSLPHNQHESPPALSPVSPKPPRSRLSSVPPEIKTSIFQDSTGFVFSKHSSYFESDNDRRQDLTRHTHNIDLFKMEVPVHYTPARNDIEVLTNKATLQAIDNFMNNIASFGIADQEMYSRIQRFVGPAENVFSQTPAPQKPPNHIIDLLIVNALLDIVIYAIFSKIQTRREKTHARSYGMILARVMKKRILEFVNPVSDFKYVSVRCEIVTLDGKHPFASPQYYNEWLQRPSSSDIIPIKESLCSSLAQIMSEVRSHFRDEIGADVDKNISKEQLDIMLSIDHSRFNIIEGPPGCGKTILAHRVCERKGKDGSVYISNSKALINRFPGAGNTAVYASDGAHIIQLLKGKLKGKKFIVIDDNQNLVYNEEDLEQLCAHIAEGDDRSLYVFQDSAFQKYQDFSSTTLANFCFDRRMKYGSLLFKTMTEIRRNTRTVGSFIMAQLHDVRDNTYTNEVSSVSSVKGDDVSLQHIPNLRDVSRRNGLLTYVQQLTDETKGSAYKTNDITVLFDHKNHESARSELAMFRILFDDFWPESCVQVAEKYPVNGIIMDLFDNFLGLESKVVIVVLPKEVTEEVQNDGFGKTLLNPKYRIAMISRGIERVDIVQEDNLSGKLATQLKFDQLPTDALHQSRKEQIPLPAIKVMLTRYVSVTPSGDLLCCTSGGIQKYYLYSGSSAEFNLSPQDLTIWCVTTKVTSHDVAAAYTSKHTDDIYVTAYSSSADSWSPLQKVGQGKVPRVAWCTTGELVICFQIRHKSWCLLKYDLEQGRVTASKTLLNEISDVAVDCNDTIYCCSSSERCVIVYKKDVSFDSKFEVDVRKRNFRGPVSVCVNHKNDIFILHDEIVNDKPTGIVTSWSNRGKYVKDVITGLPAADRIFSCLALYRPTTLGVLMKNVVNTYNVPLH